MTDTETALLLARKVAECGGTAYYVGGFVRDRLLGIENKDIDIEIHGVPAERLSAILDSMGEKLVMGESFGIFGLKGCSIDIALPRTENATGRGHKDFEIFTDPFIGTYKAAMRRDFTVNALMQNVLTGEIIDHFGGRADLEKKVLRHVSADSFPEDPLRVLRGAQFAARFGFEMAPETVELCKGIDLSALSKERVEGELKKALLKSDKPSVFFECLRKTESLDCWFPELKQFIGLEQNPAYHPEGDVWIHTMQTLDNAASYREKTEYPFGFMMSALCHDLGKIVTTAVINGKIHAYEHETKGLPLVRKFMHRLTADRKLIDYVLNMTEMHMRPNVLADHQSSVKSTNKLFDSSVCPNDLIWLASSDLLASIGSPNFDESRKWLFERLDLYNEMMKRPYVTGKDLIAAGIEQDRSFGEILAYAHKLRLAGTDKKIALKQTLAYAEKLSRSE